MKEESKQGGSSSPGQRKPAASKGYLRSTGIQFKCLSAINGTSGVYKVVNLIDAD